MTPVRVTRLRAFLNSSEIIPCGRTSAQEATRLIERIGNAAFRRHRSKRYRFAGQPDQRRRTVTGECSETCAWGFTRMAAGPRSNRIRGRPNVVDIAASTDRLPSPETYLQRGKGHTHIYVCWSAGAPQPEMSRSSLPYNQPQQISSRSPGTGRPRAVEIARFKSRKSCPDRAQPAVLELSLQAWRLIHPTKRQWRVV